MEEENEGDERERQRGNGTMTVAEKKRMGRVPGRPPWKCVWVSSRKEIVH